MFCTIIFIKVLFLKPAIYKYNLLFWLHLYYSDYLSIQNFKLIYILAL